MKPLTRGVFSLALAALVISYAQGQNPDPIMDSTVVYSFESETDSIPYSRVLYTGFSDACYPLTAELNSWDEEVWQLDGVRRADYDQEGRLVTSEELYVNPGLDKRTEYIYDGDALIFQVDYMKPSGISGIDGLWIPAKQWGYVYNPDGSTDRIDVEVFAGYWQPVGRFNHTYTGGMLTGKDKTVHITHPEVKVYYDVYGVATGGQVYQLDPFLVLNTAESADLDGIVLDDDVEFLNVYYVDGGNQRHDLTGVAGKALAAVLQGDNDQSTVVDLTTLRQDYLEWFWTEDSLVTLLNVNIKAGRAIAPQDVVDMEEDLLSENSQGQVYENTTYRVKSLATMADLEAFTVSAEMEWVSIYLNKDPEDPDAKYYRVDVMDAAGKTLKTILEENSIGIKDLSQQYFEWFRDSENDPVLSKVNIKAMRLVPVEEKPVKVYEELYASGEKEDLRMTGYKVYPDAVMDDLDQDTVEADTDLLNVYIFDGTDNQRIDLRNVAGKTLKAILSGDNQDGVVVDVAQLRQDYLEWFYDADGRIHLYNVNMKAVHSLSNRPAAEVTEDLYTSGSDIQKVTAYLVHDWASMADLEQYVLTGIDFLNVYTSNPTDGKVRYSLLGVEGKTLKAVLEGDNTDGTVIDLNELRAHYYEWFRDADERPTLVNLNIKAVEELGPAPRVVVTEDLISTSNVNHVTYNNTAYLVESFARSTDLEAVALDNDITLINVYLFDGTDNVRHDLSGVAGKSLAEAFTAAGNNEGIDIDLSQLRHNYVEWFTDPGERPQLVNLNVKAIKQVTDIDRLKESTAYAYSGSLVESTITTYYDDGGAQEGDLEKVEYTYSNELPVTEEHFTGPDGNTWNPIAKKEMAYNMNGTKAVVSVFSYETAYILDTREYFAYAMVDQTISSKDQVCEGISIDVSFVVEDNGGMASVLAVYPEGVAGSVDYSSPTEVGQSGMLTETLDNTTSTPQTVEYTFTSTASCIQDPAVETIEVIVAPTPSFSNLPADESVASGDQLNFTATSDVDGAVFSWTSTVNGDITGNTATGEGSISDILVNAGASEGTVTYTFTATGPSACVNPETSDYVVTVATDPESVEGDPLSELVIYPNPVQDILHVSLESNPGYEYGLFSISGKLIMYGQVPDGKLELDMSELEEGMYVLQITQEDSKRTLKIMK